MTVVGRDNLIKLFPNFKDDVAENGIDLRIGDIKKIINDSSKIGCVNDTKLVPRYEDVALIFDTEFEDYVYRLEPKTWYFITIDREISIPHGYTQLYLLRSSFVRCGLMLGSAVGDDGFTGTLMMGVYNASLKPVYVGKNERILQAVTITNDGTAIEYSGSYQHDKIYQGSDE